MTSKGVELRQVLLGTVGGAAVFAVSWAFAWGVAATFNALFWTAEDASIGLGLILLAVSAAIVPLGIWVLLRRLGVRGAALIGAGAIVVYVLAVQIGTEQSTYAPLYVTVVGGSGVFAVYTGLATAVAGVIAGLRRPTKEAA